MNQAVQAVEARGLTKSFGPVTVLSAVDLTVSYGEVHGLLGENGSGKSTLIKIMSGFHTPDSGTLTLSGDQIPLPVTAGKKAEHRLAFVHQHLGLVPSLTVAENLSLDEMATPGGVGMWFGIRQARALASAALSELGVDIDPSLPVSALPLIDRTRVAITRAALGVGLLPGLGASRRETSSRGSAGTLVLDEPTASLTRDEVLSLFGLIRRFATAGGAVLFVTHDLDEVLELTDRLTVLRDGHFIATRTTSEVSKSELVDLIVGRHVEQFQYRPPPARESQTLALAVSGLSSTLVHDIDLDVAPGEIVGLTGLLGSGFESVPYLLAGASPAAAGRVRLQGGEWVELSRLSPFRSMTLGIALVPSKRATEAAVMGLSVAENMQLPYDLVGRRWVTRRSIVKRSLATMRDFDVRPLKPDYPMGHLSGGNQQKAVLGRWFSRDPRVVLLCSPTQGVDVGARQQIYADLRKLAPGRAVICASADHEELAQLCDRVLVIAHGRIATELSGDQLTPAAITHACLQPEVRHAH